MFGTGDISIYKSSTDKEEVNHVGSRSLRNRLLSLEKIKLHVYGHIHGNYGIYSIKKNKDEDIISINASLVNEQYKMVNKPIEIEL